MPPAALANDMMMYVAPIELYTDNVTVMEMLCASVCVCRVHDMFDFRKEK